MFQERFLIYKEKPSRASESAPRGAQEYAALDATTHDERRNLTMEVIAANQFTEYKGENALDKEEKPQFQDSEDLIYQGGATASVFNEKFDIHKSTLAATLPLMLEAYELDKFDSQTKSLYQKHRKTIEALAAGKSAKEVIKAGHSDARTLQREVYNLINAFDRVHRMLTAADPTKAIEDLKGKIRLKLNDRAEATILTPREDLDQAELREATQQYIDNIQVALGDAYDLHLLSSTISKNKYGDSFILSHRLVPQDFVDEEALTLDLRFTLPDLRLKSMTIPEDNLQFLGGIQTTYAEKIAKRMGVSPERQVALATTQKLEQEIQKLRPEARLTPSKFLPGESWIYNLELGTTTYKLEFTDIQGHGNDYSLSVKAPDSFAQGSEAQAPNFGPEDLEKTVQFNLATPEDFDAQAVIDFIHERFELGLNNA